MGKTHSSFSLLFYKKIPFSSYILARKEKGGIYNERYVYVKKRAN